MRDDGSAHRFAKNLPIDAYAASIWRERERGRGREGEREGERERERGREGERAMAQ